MAIYEVLKADVHCDGCGKFLCELEGPKKAMEMLDRVQAKCEACGGQPLARKDQPK